MESAFAMMDMNKIIEIALFQEVKQEEGMKMVNQIQNLFWMKVLVLMRCLKILEGTLLCGLLELVLF